MLRRSCACDSYLRLCLLVDRGLVFQREDGVEGALVLDVVFPELDPADACLGPARFQDRLGHWSSKDRGGGQETDKEGRERRHDEGLGGLKVVNVSKDVVKILPEYRRRRKGRGKS